jgi:DNA repair exonuclease SbcCD ATPase subunit
MRTTCLLTLAILLGLALPPAMADERNELIAQLKEMVVARDREIAELKKQLDKRNKEFAELEAFSRKVREIEREAAAALTEARARAEAALAAERAARQLAELDAAKAAKELRDREITLQAKLAQFEARNADMTLRIAELQREIALLRQGIKPEKPLNPPPADNIQGAVKEVKDNLVVIDIGSDQGLQRGQELEVFRLKPQAKYLGKLRLVEVRPTQSVGQIVNPKEKVQTGDKVTSRIAQ